MRSWLVLAALAVAVAALGAWVYLKPSALDANTHALATLKLAEVTRVHIERAGAAAPIVIERGPAGWHMSAPYAARADAGHVERLLAILEARSAVRYPATDLARYGLNAPLGMITANGITFAYGALNAMTREQYVLAGGAVYAIPVARAAALPREPEALLARTLFGPGESPVRFELPRFTMALEDGRWTSKPAVQDSGADERVAWVDNWRNASALKVARHDGRAPGSRVKVALKDGRVLEFGVLQEAPELVLLRADEGIQYHFVVEAARRLFAFPGAIVKPEAK